jgi:hypothetical protein
MGPPEQGLPGRDDRDQPGEGADQFAHNGLTRPRNGRRLAGVVRRFGLNVLVARVATVVGAVVLTPLPSTWRSGRSCPRTRQPPGDAELTLARVDLPRRAATPSQRPSSPGFEPAHLTPGNGALCYNDALSATSRALRPAALHARLRRSVLRRAHH